MAEDSRIEPPFSNQPVHRWVYQNALSLLHPGDYIVTPVGLTSEPLPIEYCITMHTL